jgi:hypothetical protein
MNERPLWRLIAGRKVGPYEPIKLRPLVKDGRIGPLDRFSYDGETWRPVTDFPELLRPPAPPAAAAASVVLDHDPLADDPEGIDTLTPTGNRAPMVVVGRATRNDSIDDAKLLKAIYLLIAFGGGMFVLLIAYIVIASALGTTPPSPSPPQQGAAKSPAVTSANAASKEEAAAGSPLEPAVGGAGEPLVPAVISPPESGPPSAVSPPPAGPQAPAGAEETKAVDTATDDDATSPLE